MRFLPRWLLRYRRYDLFEAVPITTPQRLPSGFQFRPATVEDAEMLTTCTGTRLSEVHRRFTAGDSCFGVWRDDRPASVFWIHRGACYIRGAGLHFEADVKTAYLYAAYTPPAHRRKGLYKAGLGILTNYLVDSGVTRITQLVEPKNQPVLRTLPQLGYARVGIIRHVRILGLPFTSCLGESNLSSTCRPCTRPSHVYQI